MIQSQRKKAGHFYKSENKILSEGPILLLSALNIFFCSFKSRDTYELCFQYWRSQGRCRQDNTSPQIFCPGPYTPI